MLSQLVPLVLFGIATSFSPGPNNIMTSYTAFNFGIKKTIPTMLGVIIGWTLLIILLQLGSVSIFQKYQFIQTIIKVLGSIYLLYMAYKLSFGGQNKDEFNALMQKASDDMIKLAKAIDTAEDLRAAQKELMWSNCSACHNRFRAEH